jgi:RNA polymerase sigma-70 factor (ECF subfamily)
MHTDVETIWNEFDARIRQFVFRRVSDRAAAEDILQEVYIRIHSHIDTLREDGKLQAWLFQIARHAIIDHYRSRKATVALDETLTLPEEPDEKDDVGELALSVRKMVDCLPEKYRQALILSELQGVPHRQIAQQLGISLSGAKSRVQRGREKLREALLECCHFEFDRRGGILDYQYQPRCGCCAGGPSRARSHSDCAIKPRDACQSERASSPTPGTTAMDRNRVQRKRN